MDSRSSSEPEMDRVPPPIASGDGASGASSGEAIDLDSQLAQQTKSQIRQIVNEIADLSRQDISKETYYSGFLPRVVGAMGAIGAAIWQRSDGQWHLVAQYQIPDLLCSESTQASHNLLLDRVLVESQPVLIPPGSIKLESDRPQNPTEHLLVVAPLPAEVCGQPTLVEVVQRAIGGPATQRGYLRFVAQMVDLASDFLKTIRLRELQHWQRQSELLQTMLPKLYSDVRLRARSKNAADMLAQLLPADQVALVAKQGKTWKVLAISFVPTLDHRSEGTQAIALLAKEQFDRGLSDQWIECQSLTDESSSRFAKSLQTYTDIFAPRSLLWFPLIDGESSSPESANSLSDRDCQFALLVHWSRETIRSTAQLAIQERVSRLSGPMLGSLTTAQVDFGWQRYLPSFLRGSGTWTASTASYSTTKWLVTRAIAAAALVVICLLPMPVRLHATGSLRPIMQQRCYAPADAVVAEVLIEHNQKVQPGDLLARLEDRTLFAEIETTLGQHLETKRRFAQIENSLLRDRDLAAAEREKLVGEKSVLAESLRTLENQLKLLESRLESLTIRATTSGQIATWDVKKRLLGRPVRTGQFLFSIHQPDSEWQVEAELPVDEMGKLNIANGTAIDRPVRLSLSSHPTDVLAGQMIRVDSQASLNGQGKSVVRATIAIDRNKLPAIREGASVMVQVEAGTTPFAWWLVGDLCRTVWGKVRLWT